MNPNEKQGALEDLYLASTERLRYLLKRQETLLGNTFIIQSLPDKGSKVRAFADHLKAIIDLKTREEKDEEESADKLAANFERKVNIVSDRDSFENNLTNASENAIGSVSVKRNERSNDDCVKSDVNDVESNKNIAQLRAELGQGLEEEKVAFEVTERPSELREQSSGERQVEKGRDAKMEVDLNVASLRGQQQVQCPHPEKISRFKASRAVRAETAEEVASSPEIRLARKEEAAEKKNVLAEIFSENRISCSSPSSVNRPFAPQEQQQPKNPIFRENVPLKNSSIQSIPKPASIQRLISKRRSTSSSPSNEAPLPPPEDAVHSPVQSVFKEAKVISLAESISLQHKLKSANEARIFEDAAARLVERLKGQALPPPSTGAGVPEVNHALKQSYSAPAAGSAEALQLLGPRLAEKAAHDALKSRGVRSGNLVEGSFVEYREKTDVEDDLDDALEEEGNGPCLEDEF